MNLSVASIETKVGRIRLVGSPEGLCAVAFDDRWEQEQTKLRRWFCDVSFSTGRVAATCALEAYFDGDVAALDALQLNLRGTEFQQRVWTALRRVRAGTTASYGHIAQTIGSPRAMRAVGTANGHNPIAIVVPCHRILGSNGALVGYGGGLHRKRWLLDHEASIGDGLRIIRSSAQRALQEGRSSHNSL